MLVIGIDGGGTKTTATLMNEKGEILGVGVAGASGINSVALHVTRNKMMDAVEDAFEKANMEVCPVKAMFAGMGGLFSIDDRTIVNHMLTVMPCYDSNTVIHSANDATNSLEGGLAGRCGIVMIASTQGLAYCANEKHQHHRCGGYGFREGDAGSAYALGRECLRYASRAFDKRIENTQFTKELISYLNIETSENVIKVINEYYEDRLKTALLASFVTKHAANKDKHALEIIDNATYELSLCLSGILESVSFENKEIAIVGKVGNDPTYYKLLLERLEKLAPEYNIHKEEMQPSQGSALAALKLAKVNITDEIINNMKKTYNV